MTWVPRVLAARPAPAVPVQAHPNRRMSLIRHQFSQNIEST